MDLVEIENITLNYCLKKEFCVQNSSQYKNLIMIITKNIMNIGQVVFLIEIL